MNGHILCAVTSALFRELESLPDFHLPPVLMKAIWLFRATSVLIRWDVYI